MMDQQQLVQIGFALEAYRVRFGSYPKTLDHLSSKWLAEVPQDQFREAPYTYESDGKGYTLFGFGQDLVDSGGRPGADNVSIEFWGRTGTLARLNGAEKTGRIACPLNANNPNF
jgi:hypothetical protein